ncbi:MAG: HAD family hydrolase [Gemmatimonadetes bacterium]|nr:HAD family hydrolase [Gemmatimonadota bacterium]
MIEIIAFDADDTLWQNEALFRSTQAEFRKLLSHYHEEPWIEQRLYETEVKNLAHFGYGIKAFMLSMVETAIELTEGRVSGEEIRRILALGRAMLEAPIQLLDGAEPVLVALARSHELMLITKGDLLDQETKLERSGLRDYFRRIEVVSRKDSGSYRRVLAKYGVSPERFLMVGDSLRSDVLPVLEIGGRAVYIPHETPWAHELVEVELAVRERYIQLESIRELPAAVARLTERVPAG